MIPHSDFSKLRLSDFVPPSEIVSLSDWEFDDRLWIGEAVGFTEWLRLQSSPHALGSMALDLSALPERVVEQCLGRMGLPLRSGMTLTEITGHLGQPAGHHQFVADRATYEFCVGSTDQYDISCTVLAEGGLIYLVIQVPQAAPDNPFKPNPLRDGA